MTATVGLLFLVFFCLLAIGVPVLASIGLGVIANSLMGGVVSLHCPQYGTGAGFLHGSGGTSLYPGR